MKRKSKLEVLLWSIALPGFGQLLNGHVFKGTLFIALEIIINVFANFNTIIMLSFIGEIERAIQLTNFQWLMFYPCVYLFAMWDAYKGADGEPKPYMFIPFASAAYLVTVGLMFSTTIRIFDVLLGPVWLPMLMMIPGFGIGFFIRYLLLRILAGSQQKPLI